MKRKLIHKIVQWAALMAMLFFPVLNSFGQYTMQGYATSIATGINSSSNYNSMIFSGSFTSAPIQNGGSYFHIGDYIGANHIDFGILEMAEIQTSKLSAIKLFPNPTSSDLEILFDKAFTGKVIIYQMDGKELNQFKLQDQLNFQLDLNGFSPGSYFAVFQTNEGLRNILFQKL